MFVVIVVVVVVGCAAFGKTSSNSCAELLSLLNTSNKEHYCETGEEREREREKREKNYTQYSLTIETRFSTILFNSIRFFLKKRKENRR